MFLFLCFFWGNCSLKITQVKVGLDRGWHWRQTKCFKNDKTKQLTITIKPSFFTNSLFECENQNSKAHSSQVHKVDPVGSVRLRALASILLLLYEQIAAFLKSKIIVHSNCDVSDEPKGQISREKTEPNFCASQFLEKGVNFGETV